MKRILSSINGRSLVASNNTDNDFKALKKDENLKEKIKSRQEHDSARHKKESDEFYEKIKSVRPMSMRRV